MRYETKLCWALPVLVGLAVVIVMTGCGEKAAQTVVEKAIKSSIESDAAKNGEDVDVNVDLSKGTMTMTGKDGEKVNMQMDSDKGTMTINGEDGLKIETTEDGAKMTAADGTQMVSGANAKLPDDFPKDVPQYKGMKLVMVTTAPDGGIALTATTPDSMDQVAAFYKKEAKANGWTEDMAMDMDEMKNLKYSKEGRGMNVMVMKSEDETGIQLTLMKE